MRRRGIVAILPAPLPQDATSASTTSFTGRASSARGPKLNASQKRSGASAPARRAPRSRYPESGSSTCCHGRTARGLRTGMGRRAASAAMASGTIRSFAQSPPPTTFPARALATATPCSRSRAGGKKLRRYEATTSSAAPFDIE